jgi:hypothetical protein
MFVCVEFKFRTFSVGHNGMRKAFSKSGKGSQIILFSRREIGGFIL